MPTVSIITPVKVRDKQQLGWLAECIESVKAQTFEDWEMVLVNDHSPVSWKPLADLFGDPRLRGMTARKEGVSHARNEAATESKSDLLLPLDGDDKLRPNSLGEFLRAWRNGGSDKGFVYSDIFMFGQDFARLFQPPPYDFGTLLRTTFLTVGCLHRKSDWEKVGGWSVELEQGLEDWEYWIKFGEKGVCGYHIPKVLYEYRRHTLGRYAAMREDKELWQAQLQKMRDLHLDVYNGRWPMGCCGGTAPTATPRKQIVRGRPDRDSPLQNSVTIKYMGGRSGGFGMRGKATNREYRVPGRGVPFTIERSDLAFVMKLNFGRDFNIVGE